MKQIVYHLRGNVERGNGRGYDWHDGYSANSEDGSPLFPWQTKRECQADAKAQGATAVFSTAQYTGQSGKGGE